MKSIKQVQGAPMNLEVKSKMSLFGGSAAINDLFKIKTLVKKPYLLLVLHFGIKSQRH